MARSRLLKPGFFKNEHLAQLSPHARLCFAGLWLLADREGRLEDRPLRLKAEIFPYEQLDMNALLTVLSDGGFIVRYSHEKAAYLAIPTFPKHQSPHIKETPSTIPAPYTNGASTRLAPVEPSLDPLVTLTLNPIPCIDPDPVKEPPYPPKGGRITRTERQRAEHIRTKVRGRCTHQPKCTNFNTCVERIALESRRMSA